ncbi:subunit length determinant protein [Chitinophaga niastensis]|uniref:Subunit length determinant protein n=1 Tax=Chitinophaga niastensis TaxID=536980 RepID=A0A2P8HRW9_CHINA|nr:Wzz/FepE/Etk N-terminal domain-containing protein [Chitinophaga niastensis]PSL48957.1 subunit length determinant protein [Chitinophaga niastensis]
MEVSHTNSHIETKENDEISIKELILKLQVWWRYLLKKWWVIVLFGLLGAAVGLILAFVLKPKYVAELTFVAEDNNGSALGAYSGIASQFGIDLGGGGGSGVFQGENVMAFLKSRLMIEKVLLSVVDINGEKSTLIERYIDFNQLRDGWTKPKLKAVKYPTGADRGKFTLQQDSILNEIQLSIAKSQLKVEKVDKKLDFILVSCKNEDELFSKFFVERLVNEATAFYISTKTQRSQTNVDRLQSEADSLEIMLNRKTYSAAQVQDLNMNPAKQIAGVGMELAARDKLVLQTMYAEVVKNLELAKITMAQETPIIQIVDTPILPLRKEKLGKVKGLMLGGIGGGFLIVIILIIRKLLKDLFV